MSLSPMVGSNIFSLAFGMNLDAHSPPRSNRTSLLPSAPSENQCLQGRACYIDSLYITIAACFLALFLSIWAGRKDRRKSSLKGLAPAEVVWEGIDD
jgi:hypothetical protein